MRRAVTGGINSAPLDTQKEKLARDNEQLDRQSVQKLNNSINGKKLLHRRFVNEARETAQALVEQIEPLGEGESFEAPCTLYRTGLRGGAGRRS